VCRGVCPGGVCPPWGLSPGGSETGGACAGRGLSPSGLSPTGSVPVGVCPGGDLSPVGSVPWGLPRGVCVPPVGSTLSRGPPPGRGSPRHGVCRGWWGDSPPSSPSGAEPPPGPVPPEPGGHVTPPGWNSPRSRSRGELGCRAARGSPSPLWLQGAGAGRSPTDAGPGQHHEPPSRPPSPGAHPRWALSPCPHQHILWAPAPESAGGGTWRWPGTDAPPATLAGGDWKAPWRDRS